MRIYCEICEKQKTTKRRHENYVSFCDYSMNFCDEHYDEFNKYLRNFKKEYPELNEYWKAKPTTREWHIMCKLEELVVLDFIFKGIGYFVKSQNSKGRRK